MNLTESCSKHWLQVHTNNKNGMYFANVEGCMLIYDFVSGALLFFSQ